MIVPGTGVFMEEIDRNQRDAGLEPLPKFGLALEDLERPVSEILEELEAFLVKCLAQGS